jgi:UDP:flavonoid glycosyltransferase YjiC (YdhE family)
MDQPFRENLPGKARILVAPLDWGLGHATRCIPLVRELLAQGAEVWLAGEGAQQQLLQAEFPEIPFLPLPGYRVRYAKTAGGLFWKMMFQVPRIQRAIRFENDWLKKTADEYQLDAVISDNRYGLYHEKIPSVFITHQLLIKSPAGKWTEKILQKRNYRYINRFSACWVPDAEGPGNLGGELSHPEKKPGIPLQYTGPLSRFTGSNSDVAANNHLLILLSGPEPQRSLLEEKIIREIAHYNGKATIVRGLPGSSALIPSTNMIRFYNHLPAAELETIMQQADYVICRSGYSSVMDIAALKKKSILVPTPGQTEQEYLGDYLQQKGFAPCLLQKNFSIDTALKAARAFSYSYTSLTNRDRLQQIIREFLNSIVAGN